MLQGDILLIYDDLSRKMLPIALRMSACLSG